MSVYKRKLRNGKRSRYYTAEFTYRGTPHRKGWFPDRESAKHWAHSESQRLRRGGVGYVKPMHASVVPPLITLFIDHLRAANRDDMYAYIAEKRLNRLAGDCGWLTLGAATRESLRAWLNSDQLARAGANRGKPIGNRTKNQYLDTAVEWGAWLASEDVGKLPSNPFAGMKRLTAKHNDLYRRAGAADELDKLLASCPAERRPYYLFRIYHASMRRRTVRHLSWRMLHLDAAPPFALIPAEFDKSRRDTRYVLRYDLAQSLRAEKKRLKAKADDAVFPVVYGLDVLRADLAKAGVAFADAQGNRRLDYHALRRTLVKIGKAAGLTLDQVSLLLGHKSIETTRKWYDDDQVRPELGASMEKLPTLGKVRRAL